MPGHAIAETLTTFAAAEAPLADGCVALADVPEADWRRLIDAAAESNGFYDPGFAVNAAKFARGGHGGEVLLALGHANWLLWFTMLWFVASLSSFAIGVQWGVIGVAACYAIATLLVEPIRTYVTARALGTSPWRFVAALSGVAQAAALMAVLLLVVRSALVAADVPSALRLAVLIVAGSAAYVLGCLWRAPEVTSEIRVAIGRRRPEPQPVSVPLERV